MVEVIGVMVSVLAVDEVVWEAWGWWREGLWAVLRRGGEGLWEWRCQLSWSFDGEVAIVLIR